MVARRRVMLPDPIKLNFNQIKRASVMHTSGSLRSVQTSSTAAESCTSSTRVAPPKKLLLLPQVKKTRTLPPLPLKKFDAIRVTNEESIDDILANLDSTLADLG